MAWPTPQEYNEAIQNPRANFRDHELRSLRPDLSPLGLPIPVTGNFASVYRLTSGAQQRAVRCFFRHVPDMQARYAAVSAYLERCKLPHAVGFTYLDEGIAVRSVTYPVLKMEWVEGELLDVYIRRRLEESEALQDLARAWIDLAQVLGSHGTAHGDLQHGNVIVKDGEVRLVDYDGMFVPALHGKRSLELGHPNYQHPQRDESVFGPNMDNFSHWVIYTSLIALSHDPSLWVSLGAGDERLIFSHTDFRDPSASPAFTALTTHSIPKVRSLAGALREFLDKDPDCVPALEGVPPKSGRQRRRLSRSLTAQRIGLSQPVSNLPGWVVEALPIAQQERFASPPGTPRVCLAAAGGVIVSGLVPATNALLTVVERIELSAGAATLAWVVVLASYLSDPAVRKQSRLRLTSVSLIVRRHWISTRISRQNRRLPHLHTDIQTKRHQIDTRLAASVNRTAMMRNEVSRLVDEAMRPLKAAKIQLKKEEEDTLAEALGRHQKLSLQAFLRGHTLRSAPIQHLTILDKAKLWAMGVRSAADVDPNHKEAIDTLPEIKSASLLAWSSGLLRNGIRSLPSDMSLKTRASIETKYRRQRKRLDDSRRRILMDCTPVLAAISRLSDAGGPRPLHRLSTSLEGLESKVTQSSGRKAQLEGQEADLLRMLDKIDGDLVPYENLTFARYALLFLTGYRSGPHGAVSR